jgi:hypothetical protein
MLGKNPEKWNAFAKEVALADQQRQLIPTLDANPLLL